MTLAQMKTRVWQRLDEDAASPLYYTAAAVTAALNEGARLLALLSLHIERTVTFDVPTLQPFLHMLDYYADWIVPLRVECLAGVSVTGTSRFDSAMFDEVLFDQVDPSAAPTPLHVRPARLDELDALSAIWQTVTGATTLRYGVTGFDLVHMYPNPAVVGTQWPLIYAAFPVALAIDTDVPEAPAEHHLDLIEYAIYALRLAEGGQEFQKGLQSFARFLDGAATLAASVRARSLAMRYDHVPFELTAADRSRLIGAGTKKQRPTELVESATEVAA